MKTQFTSFFREQVAIKDHLFHPSEAAYLQVISSTDLKRWNSYYFRFSVLQPPKHEVMFLLPIDRVTLMSSSCRWTYYCILWREFQFVRILLTYIYYILSQQRLHRQTERDRCDTSADSSILKWKTGRVSVKLQVSYLVKYFRTIS